jgi:two-component system sensor kinase FixL
MKTFLSMLEKAGFSAGVRDLRTDTILLTPGLWSDLGYEGDGSSISLDRWHSLIHPDDLAGHERRVEDHLAGRSDRLHSRFRLKDADGNWRILETNAGVVERGHRGEALFIGGMIADSTSTSPLTSPALFKTVVEAAHEGIWMIDLDGRTWFANQRMADMLGTVASAMFGRPPTDFCLPEDADVARGIISRNLEGEPVAFEFRFQRSDGSEIPVLGGSAPIRDETGAITGSVAMFSDLSDRKAAENALLESERQARENHVRLAAAQEGAGAGTWEADLRTGAVRLDQLSLMMHGLAADTPMPMTKERWATTLDANGQEALEALSDCGKTGAQFSFEFSTGGGETWILGLGRGLRGPDGEVAKLVGLNLNITESKRAEQQLARLRGELIHLSRISAMGSMASTIAHELNQPLAAASNFLSVAQMSLKRGDPNLTDEAIDAAIRATLKAGQIIRRIRDGATSREPVRRDLDLRDVANSALELALLDAPQRGIKVKKHLRRGVRVRVDPIQIEQVIVNLVRNAVEVIGVESDPTITISMNVNRGRAVVQVADNGPGVSPAMAERLFETFSSSKKSGMGMGLSISRTIIEAHGGRIWLDKTSEAGAIFKFDLPRMMSSTENGMDDSPESLEFGLASRLNG